MELKDVIINGIGYDSEYRFHNQALTLVFTDQNKERTIRANLHFYPSENLWDLNPIFYEFSDVEKQELIQQILETHKVKETFN